MKRSKEYLSFSKNLQIVRYCQDLLYSPKMKQDKRLLELAIFCLAMGKNKMSWETLAIEGFLIKNDYDKYKDLIRDGMPEIENYNDIESLYLCNER